MCSIVFQLDFDFASFVSPCRFTPQTSQPSSSVASHPFLLLEARTSHEWQHRESRKPRRRDQMTWMLETKRNFLINVNFRDCFSIKLWLVVASNFFSHSRSSLSPLSSSFFSSSSPWASSRHTLVRWPSPIAHPIDQRKYVRSAMTLALVKL